MKKIVYAIMFSMLSMGVKAQVFPRYTENEKSAVNYCRSLDTKILTDIKAKMIATGTVGIASSLGNISSAIITGIGKNTKDTGTGIAATVATGVATAGSGVNTTLSGLSLADLNKLISDYEKCKEGFNTLSFSSN